MKRNILARRAASAALAACMMFSLSAPALAASTDALLQQSAAAKNAVSVLGEKNGALKIGNSSFDTETNIHELELGGGTISYDAETHTLTLNGVNIEDSSRDWVIDFDDEDTPLNLVLMGEISLKVRAALEHMISRFPAPVRCRSQRQTMKALPVSARVEITSRLDLMLTSLP